MENVDLQTAAIELRSLTGRILRAARQDTEQQMVACKVDISSLQYGILRILKDKKFTLSELSGLIGREPATLVPAVDALESKGMLQRGHDPKDRRRTPLTISPQGLEVLERVSQMGENKLLVNVLQRMGDRKASHLITLLREVALQVEQDKNPIAVNE
jgi:DNA-binding MarR family transcriptional regulator